MDMKDYTTKEEVKGISWRCLTDSKLAKAAGVEPDRGEN